MPEICLRCHSPWEVTGALSHPIVATVTIDPAHLPRIGTGAVEGLVAERIRVTTVGAMSIGIARVHAHQHMVIGTTGGLVAGKTGGDQAAGILTVIGAVEVVDLAVHQLEVVVVVVVAAVAVTHALHRLLHLSFIR